MRVTPNLIPRFNLDYNFNDFVYAVKSIFAGNGIELASLRCIFGDRNFFFTNTGRTSLYAILKALNLPKGSKIGVPLYSCTAVFDAIIKAGCTPTFIDIDPDNYTLDSEDLVEKVDDLGAVIVIHTFGRPTELDKIKEIAGKILIIEDCAHSFLSRYKKEQTGTLGFASFFSFKKYISMGEGGMIVLNNSEFADDFKREIDLLDSFTTLNEIKDAFITYGHSFLYHEPWFGLFSYPIGSYLRTTINQDEDIDFKVKKIRKSDFGLLFKKLNGFEEKVELQRKNSFFLLKELRNTSLILPYEKKDTYCNYYLFPIRFNNKEERDKAHEHLKDMGIDTAKLYSETPKEAKRFYEYKGDCPNSEIVADTILIIPNYYTLDEKDLVKIVDKIKKVERLL